MKRAEMLMRQKMNDDDFDWIEDRKPSIWPLLIPVIMVGWGIVVLSALAWAVSWLAGRVM